jgi:TM2 domain-containing membrane protein YozV
VQLCSRCHAAVEAGRSHCPICDQPVAADQTWVQGQGVAPGPPPPAVGPSHPAPYPPPGHGYGMPGYGAPGYAAPGYAAPGYGAPGYGAPPAVAVPYKSKAAAALLCFFLGGLGIHRFYTGQAGLGLALLLTTLFLGWTIVWLAVTFVWVMVDFVLILTGGVHDQWGRPLV